jgi:hypothetical protein
MNSIFRNAHALTVHSKPSQSVQLRFGRIIYSIMMCSTGTILWRGIKTKGVRYETLLSLNKSPKNDCEPSVPSNLLAVMHRKSSQVKEKISFS